MRDFKIPLIKWDDFADVDISNDISVARFMIPLAKLKIVRVEDVRSKRSSLGVKKVKK